MKIKLSSLKEGQKAIIQNIGEIGELKQRVFRLLSTFSYLVFVLLI